MINRISRIAFGSARQLAKKPSAWALIVRDTLSGFRTTAHHTLMTGGIVAISTLAILFFNPQLADYVKALSPFSSEAADQDFAKDTTAVNPLDAAPKPLAQSAPQQPLAGPSLAAVAASSAPIKSAAAEDHAQSASINPQQQRVTAWIAKRYRVATDATNMLVSAAYGTAKEIKLDPLLILAVMAIESRFNPFAESPVGAQGLMQVMSKVHHDKFQKLGGVKAALNPVANIKVGSLILKDYVKRGGSVEAGLRMYVGAPDSDDSGYGSKVLAEYRRLKDVAQGKRVPTTTTTVSAQPKRVEPVEKDNAMTEVEAAAEGQAA